MKRIIRAVSRRGLPPKLGAMAMVAVAATSSLNTPSYGSTPLPGFKKSLKIQDVEERVAQIFEDNCAFFGCHVGSDPPKGLNLSSEFFYSRLVDVVSQEKPELKRVKPGDPANSYLVMKIKGAPGIEGKQMPFGGRPLTQEEIATIEQWIAGITQVDVTRKKGPPRQVVQPFVGWRVVNLPTTQTLDRGLWLFLIGHRFNPKLDTGFDTLFGLDGSAIMFLSLGYAVSDRLLVYGGRSNAADTYELAIRYRLAQQALGGGSPVALAIQASTNWVSEKRAGKDRIRGEAFKFSGQAILSRELEKGLSVDIVPGVLINPDVEEEGDDPIVTIGVGGRWKFYRNFSLVGEWVPIVSGYIPTRTFGNLNRFDSWGAGLEAQVGGHVFQVFVTNSVGITADQYLRGGDLDIEDLDVRLGFNIFRVLSF